MATTIKRTKTGRLLVSTDGCGMGQTLIQGSLISCVSYPKNTEAGTDKWGEPIIKIDGEWLYAADVNSRKIEGAIVFERRHVK